MEGGGDWREQIRELIDERIQRFLFHRARVVFEFDHDQFAALLAALGGSAPPAKAHLVFSITTSDGRTINGVPPLMLTLKDNQSADYTVSGTDAAGNPAPIVGPLTATVSDPTVLSATVNGDVVTVKALGPLTAAGASVQLVVTDTGDNAPTGITGTDDITVIASAAVSLQLSAGAPTP
jgi:hypothetical protein